MARAIKQYNKAPRTAVRGRTESPHTRRTADVQKEVIIRNRQANAGDALEQNLRRQKEKLNEQVYQDPTIPFTQKPKPEDDPEFGVQKRINKNLGLNQLAKPLQLKTKFYWRLKLKQWFRVVFVMIKLLREVRRKREHNREGIIMDFERKFKLFREKTSVWATDVCRDSIKNIILDCEGSLHYNTNHNPRYVDKTEKEYRINYIKTIIEDILEDLMQGTTHEHLDTDHLIFFYNFTEDGAYMSNNFLTQYEMNRVLLDHQGGLIGQDDTKKKMLLGMFILGKLFVP